MRNGFAIWKWLVCRLINGVHGRRYSPRSPRFARNGWTETDWKPRVALSESANPGLDVLDTFGVVIMPRSARNQDYAVGTQAYHVPNARPGFRTNADFFGRLGQTPETRYAIAALINFNKSAWFSTDLNCGNCCFTFSGAWMRKPVSASPSIAVSLNESPALTT